MTTNNDPAQRSDAIFEALDASEVDEQAEEAAVVEGQARRLERIRDRVNSQD